MNKEEIFLPNENPHELYIKYLEETHEDFRLKDEEEKDIFLGEGGEWVQAMINPALKFVDKDQRRQWQWASGVGHFVRTRHISTQPQKVQVFTKGYQPKKGSDSSVEPQSLENQNFEKHGLFQLEHGDTFKVRKEKGTPGMLEIKCWGSINGLEDPNKTNPHAQQMRIHMEVPVGFEPEEGRKGQEWINVRSVVRDRRSQAERDWMWRKNKEILRDRKYPKGSYAEGKSPFIGINRKLLIHKQIYAPNELEEAQLNDLKKNYQSNTSKTWFEERIKQTDQHRKRLPDYKWPREQPPECIHGKLWSVARAATALSNAGHDPDVWFRAKMNPNLLEIRTYQHVSGEAGGFQLKKLKIGMAIKVYDKKLDKEIQKLKWQIGRENQSEKKSIDDKYDQLKEFSRHRTDISASARQKMHGRLIAMKKKQMQRVGKDKKGLARFFKNDPHWVGSDNILYEHFRTGKDVDILLPNVEFEARRPPATNEKSLFAIGEQAPHGQAGMWQIRACGGEPGEFWYIAATVKPIFEEHSERKRMVGKDGYEDDILETIIPCDIPKKFPKKFIPHRDPLLSRSHAERKKARKLEKKYVKSTPDEIWLREELRAPSVFRRMYAENRERDRYRVWWANQAKQKIPPRPPPAVNQGFMFTPFMRWEEFVDDAKFPWEKWPYDEKEKEPERQCGATLDKQLSQYKPTNEIPAFRDKFESPNAELARLKKLNGRIYFKGVISSKFHTNPYIPIYSVGNGNGKPGEQVDTLKGDKWENNKSVVVRASNTFPEYLVIMNLETNEEHYIPRFDDQNNATVEGMGRPNVPLFAPEEEEELYPDLGGGKRKTKKKTKRKRSKKKKNFKKHYMWNTLGKRYLAKTYKQHVKGSKLGHTHKKLKRKTKRRKRKRRRKRKTRKKKNS